MNLLREWGDHTESPFAKAVAARGSAVIDLITASPNENDFAVDEAMLRAVIDEAMKQRHVRSYAPVASGQIAARLAIARYYGDDDPQRIVLTPGTSMGYFYGLRLLTEPGDEILVPKPGYPLLDDLCAVCGIGIRNYHLKEADEGWRIDIDDLEFQITKRTRAVVIVSPHNPTGSVCSATDYERLAAICQRHSLALFVDEVFCEFLRNPSQLFPRPIGMGFPLAITLNGFSKMFSLPAWKIAWMRIEGDPARTRTFLNALDHLSDTFLPVNELTQAMISPLLKNHRGIVGGFAQIFRERMAIARELSPLPTKNPAGGVYLCAELPSHVNDEQFAIRLLDNCGVLMHPGYFYGLPRHLVMTCVAQPDQLREGLTRLRTACESFA